MRPTSDIMYAVKRECTYKMLFKRILNQMSDYLKVFCTTIIFQIFLILLLLTPFLRSLKYHSTIFTADGNHKGFFGQYLIIVMVI